MCREEKAVAWDYQTTATPSGGRSMSSPAFVGPIDLKWTLISLDVAPMTTGPFGESFKKVQKIFSGK
jgi:hypothetical protein